MHLNRTKNIEARAASLTLVMQRSCWLALAIMAMGCSGGSLGVARRSGGMAAAEPVATRTINRDWTFNYLPAKTEDLAISREDYDDAAWTAVALPHTWMTYETTRELHPFIRNASETDDPYWWHGWGYYRKRFAIDARHRGKKVFVEFDGVQKYCRAYLNGEFVGEHKGGFTSFSLDLTDKIRFGENNLLTLAVSNQGNILQESFAIPPARAAKPFVKSIKFRVL